MPRRAQTNGHLSSAKSDNLAGIAARGLVRTSTSCCNSQVWVPGRFARLCWWFPWGHVKTPWQGCLSHRCPVSLFNEELYRRCESLT